MFQLIADADGVTLCAEYYAVECIADKYDGQGLVVYQFGAAQILHANTIFIYTEDNFDNDDIISRVDAIPTCERTKEELKKLK